MTSISPTDPLAKSADLTADNLTKLSALFPEAFTEGQVDFAVLRQLLGGAVDERDEKYGLNWHGKRDARRLALTPSTGTLRPVPEQSVDWDTTQNLMIEGDNLEALKLLQKSYTNKVKLIYIDPPYNTGNDFVYADDFSNSLAHYKEITGQTKDGVVERSKSNAESSGRFHTDWLNMMYPRLKLARNLLSDDGTIFISIDENEIQNLRMICDDIFGSECFIAAITLLCNPKGRSQDKYFATNHEYILVYSRSLLPKGHFSISKGEEQIEAEYQEEDEGGKYRLLELRNTHREFGRHNRKNLFYSFFVNEQGNVSIEKSTGLDEVAPLWDDGFEGCWTWDKAKAEKDLALLVAQKIKGKWKIYRKSYASGADRMLKTILTDSSFFTERGQREFNTIFDVKDKIFQSPKSPHLITQFIQAATANDSLILDFFAGSGTTGHAVMAQNAADGGTRRFILVQLPEPTRTQKENGLYDTSPAWLAGYPNIAEITKARLRRVGKKISDETPMFTGDLGFRVFKLDSTNVREWDPAPADLSNALLDHAAGRIKRDRSAADLLAELQLKLGLDLCAPAATRTIAGKTVTALGGGILYACLADTIATNDIEPLASGLADWHASLAPDGAPTVVFRDDAFADDIAKTNLTAILEQRGLKNIRSL